MSSDEATSSSFENLEEYTSTWADKGYDIEAITGQFSQGLTLSDIEKVEALIQQCDVLKKRLSLFNQEDEFQSRLTDPFNFEIIESEFIEWISTHSPWESACNRYYSLWASTSKKEEQYWSLMTKFSLLDESSWPAIQLLTPFLSEPETYENILFEVSKIEESEARQRQMLDEALTILREQGFTVPKPTGNFIEQLSQIEHYQAISDRREYILLEIKNSIQQFDPILSETLEKRANELEVDDAASLEKLEKNIQTISHHLKERLEEMNTLLANWNNLGFTYHSTTKIAPSDLLEWEHMLPEIEQSFNIHSTAMERWEAISRSWGLETDEIHNIAGKLEHTEAFLEKIEGLEQEWTNLELQIASIIEHWEQYGFDLDVWRYKATEEPRSALTELNQYVPSLEKASNLMDLFFNLDTSLGGEEEVEQRTTILQTSDLDAEILSEMEEWIEKKTLRNTRHRRMLEREWRNYVRMGKTTKEPDFSDLYSFEQGIALLERQGQSHQIEDSSSRVVTAAKHEIQTLESQGWNVSELAILAEENPKEFIRQFSSSRSAISNIAKIQRRLSALDWRRDVTKGLEISEMIRNPISLKGIETQIPALIRHLSSRPIEDDEFRYPLWSPIQRPVLIPQNETLYPLKNPVIKQPQTTLEDAHDAMLDAMEEATKTDTEVIEEKLEQQALERKDEKEAPKTKPEPKIIEEQVQDVPIQKPVEIEEPRTEGQPSPRLQSSFQTILERLALPQSMVFNAQGTLDTKHLRRTLAEHVGIEPRDVRVDRTLRLLLRLLPSNDSFDNQRAVLIDKIGEALPKYQQWLRMRLEARHSGATGNFLEDSIQLGVALERTPGPGVKVPLSADTTPLPDPSNLQDLEKSVQRLVEALDLNTAGGVN
ncbi:MAG: hypothetical protein ACPHX8_05060 [Candidatus Poseidoniaceae archaeon]